MTDPREAARFTPMVEALLPYPQIDPVLIQFGPVAIRWYALSYISGLLLGWWLIVKMLRQASLWKNPPFKGNAPATADQILQEWLNGQMDPAPRHAPPRTPAARVAACGGHAPETGRGPSRGAGRP